jgi:2-polyprenyl-3-methyl-5-hydroxy-6-metoxy-1,4-benzoquinol methylase
MHNSSTWNTEYYKGRWNYLRSPEQRPRYVLVADWCRTYFAASSVLDVGCGEGLLARELSGVRGPAYHGIDFAEAAVVVGRDRTREQPLITFETASMESYEPTRPYDVVIFNESLYCCLDPLGTLRRYARYLTPAGGLLLSITTVHADLALLVERIYGAGLLASTVVTDRCSRKGWHLLALRGGAGAA